jgi:hypothetical protein
MRGVHDEPGFVTSMLVSMVPYSVTALCAWAVDTTKPHDIDTASKRMKVFVGRMKSSAQIASRQDQGKRVGRTKRAASTPAPPPAMIIARTDDQRFNAYAMT